MSHSKEGVTEDAGGKNPVLSINQQHAFQQRHKLPPVCLLCLHVTVIRTQHQVHLISEDRKQQFIYTSYFCSAWFL